MLPSFYKGYLSQSLALGGSETTVYVNTLQTLTGEAVSFSNFSPFTRGIIVVDPEAQTGTQPEIISFTGTDSAGVAFTGAVRGLSSVTSSTVSANKVYHPTGTPVIISWGAQNISDLVTYVKSLMAGTLGTASNSVNGSTKITEDLSTKPRAMAALVSEQTPAAATLKVQAFKGCFTDKIVSYAGGSTASFSAPSANPRVDLVVYNTDSAAIAVRTGTEAASPSTPTPTTNDIVLCEVYNRVGQTSVKENDDGSNGYVRRWYQPGLYRTDLATQSYVNNLVRFGGTGADGALSVSSGTTTIDLGAAQTFVKNYTSISITGTGKVAFTNPHANGTTIILKSQGNVTLTSSQAPMLDASGMGAAGGASVSSSGTASGNNGSAGYGLSLFQTNPGQGSGTAGAVPSASAANVVLIQATNKYPVLIPGSGGGSGGVDCGGGSTGTSGAGGRGGAALAIECAGALNFTTANGISVAGATGQNGSGTGAAFAAGGGGNGSGGVFLCFYNSLTANSGTVTVANASTSTGAGAGGARNAVSGGGGGSLISAGSAGGSGSTGGTGGAGATGVSLIAKNTEFA